MRAKGELPSLEDGTDRESSSEEDCHDQSNVDNEDKRTIKSSRTHKEITDDGMGLHVHLNDIYETSDTLSRNNFQSFLDTSSSGDSINQSFNSTSGQSYLGCLLQLSQIFQILDNLCYPEVSSYEDSVRFLPQSSSLSQTLGLSQDLHLSQNSMFSIQSSTTTKETNVNCNTLTPSYKKRMSIESNTLESPLSSVFTQGSPNADANCNWFSQSSINTFVINSQITNSEVNETSFPVLEFPFRLSKEFILSLLTDKGEYLTNYRPGDIKYPENFHCLDDNDVMFNVALNENDVLSVSSRSHVWNSNLIMFYMDYFFLHFQKNDPGKIVILPPELGQKLMKHDSSIPKNQLYDIKDAILIFLPFGVGDCWNLMVTVHPNLMKIFVEHSQCSMEYD